MQCIFLKLDLLVIVIEVVVVVEVVESVISKFVECFESNIGPLTYPF